MNLFLDGVLIDSVVVDIDLDKSTNFLVSAANSDVRVFIARGELLDAQTTENGSGIPADLPAIPVSIDDAQLVRLASVAPQRLPGNLVPVPVLITNFLNPTNDEITQQLAAVDNPSLPG